MEKKKSVSPLVVCIAILAAVGGIAAAYTFFWPEEAPPIPGALTPADAPSMEKPVHPDPTGA